MKVPDALDRRVALFALAAASLLANARQAFAANNGDLVQNYIRIRGNPDGAPAYWLSRGTRYLLADYQMTPLHANIMASCVVADRRDDGSVVVRTLEGAYATELDTENLIDGFINPASGARVALTPGAPVVVTYQYRADGRMTFPAGEQARPGTDLRGALAARNAYGGELAIEERFALRTRTAAATSDLSEQIIYSATAAADGTVSGATKSMVVLRNWPYDKDQPQLMLLAAYQGKRLDSFEALMAEIGPGKLEMAQPGFADRLAKYR